MVGADLLAAVACVALADRKARAMLVEVDARASELGLCFLLPAEGGACVARVAVGVEQRAPAINVDLHDRAPCSWFAVEQCQGRLCCHEGHVTGTLVKPDNVAGYTPGMRKAARMADARRQIREVFAPIIDYEPREEPE